MRQSGLANFIFQTFALCLILDALQAYSVFGIPVPWLADVLMVGLFFVFAFRAGFARVPGLSLFALFLAWAAFSYFFILLYRGMPQDLPESATLTYFPFVALRFLKMLVFAFALVIVHWLNKNAQGERLIDFVVSLGLVISLYALYVYFASGLGWPEIPRTRIGTDGGDQATVFSYAFHRALGSFREPSHLGEWLILPLFFSLFKYRSPFNIPTLCMALVLLLTGSLTGISGFLMGGALGLILNWRWQKKFLIQPLQVIGLILISVLIFSVTVKNSRLGIGSTSLTEVLWSRVAPIIYENGLKSSNRGYVYSYVDREPFSVVGDGVGNANIEFSNREGSAAMGSFLSLYVNALYTTGFIGFTLLALFILYPFRHLVYFRRHVNDAKFYCIFGAYFAWLIIFSVHTEELTLQFALAYAFLCAMMLKSPKPIDDL